MTDMNRIIIATQEGFQVEGGFHTRTQHSAMATHTVSLRFCIDGGTSNLILAGIEDYLLFEGAHRAPSDAPDGRRSQQILGRDDGAHHTTNPLVDFELDAARVSSISRWYRFSSPR